MTEDTPPERPEVIEYYKVVIKDIADDKARFWRFLAAFAAITAALLNMDLAKLSPWTKLLLVAAHSIAAVFTMLIAYNTTSNLKKRRHIADKFDERWKIRDIIGQKKKPDIGNWLFELIGYVAPPLSVAIVVVHFLCRPDIAAFFGTYLLLLACEFDGR